MYELTTAIIAIKKFTKWAQLQNGHDREKSEL